VGERGYERWSGESRKQKRTSRKRALKEKKSAGEEDAEERGKVMKTGTRKVPV
jgi:hypothetical protein